MIPLDLHPENLGKTERIPLACAAVAFLSGRGESTGGSSPTDCTHTIFGELAAKILEPRCVHRTVLVIIVR